MPGQRKSSKESGSPRPGDPKSWWPQARSGNFTVHRGLLYSPQPYALAFADGSRSLRPFPDSPLDGHFLRFEFSLPARKSFEGVWGVSQAAGHMLRPVKQTPCER